MTNYINLLGKSNYGCSVSGKYIVKLVDNDTRFITIYTAETNEEAERVYKAWMNELFKGWDHV